MSNKPVSEELFASSSTSSGCSLMVVEKSSLTYDQGHTGRLFKAHVLNTLRVQRGAVAPARLSMYYHEITIIINQTNKYTKQYEKREIKSSNAV
jgi:hypothetical protein